VDDPNAEDIALPPHIVDLANGHRYGYSVLVDAERGTTLWKLDGVWGKHGMPGIVGSF
jgi:hypothetical protein